MVTRAWRKLTLLAALAGALTAGALTASTLSGCDAKDDTAAPQATALSPQAVYVRASLDVRGIRPTTAEVNALAQTPEQLDSMVAALVDDPRFGDRVRDMFAPAVRTRRDMYRFSAPDLGFSEDEAAALQLALSEETLNIIHYVAVNNRPFSEILTADYTIVQPILYQIWPLEPAAEQPAGRPQGTELAHYTDERPAAGVLSTNSFYWRHTSTVENANRGRTNAITRAFLCEDYLERPIDFPKDVDLTDSEGIREAIKSNAGCQACHATMDPLASHLWGFMQVADDPLSWSFYHPENEPMFKQQTGAPPAFFGKPTSGTLSSLAQAIAADERFISCTTRRVYEALLGRPAELADDGQLAQHREAFLGSGLLLKELVRSVLQDPAYRGISQVSAFGGEPEPVVLKLVSPSLLSSSLADLSGYRLSFLGRDLTELDVGVRALAGGSERGPSATPSLGRALVHRRLAEGSALALVNHATPSSRVGVLLGNADLNARPTAEWLVSLLLEVQSLQLEAQAAQVQALLTLFDEVASSQDSSTAWAAVLTAVFADPTLAVY